MSNLLFITGTDTDVGKTVVSRILITGLMQRGINVGVVKPVETGCELGANGELVAADGVKLWQTAGAQQDIDEVAPYRFAAPAAPQVAAAKEDRIIDYKAICIHLEAMSSQFPIVIVEGAGGLLVPLYEARTFADLAVDMAMSVIVVVGSRLGCINHASLTFEVLNNRNIEAMGYVLNEGRRSDESTVAFATNRVSVSRAASVYGFTELAKVGFAEDIDEPSVLAEIASMADVKPLIDAVIKEFALI